MSQQPQSAEMDNYWSFSTPNPHAAYSLEYFQNLTFYQSTELDFPLISPPKTLIDWKFTDDVPSNAAGTLILHNDVILDAADLLPITQAMENEYKLGHRSVFLRYHTSEHGIVERLYHFSKVWML